MTPKEEAKELVNKFMEKIPFADKEVYKDWKKEMLNKAIQCALICVDDKMKFIIELQISDLMKYDLIEYQEAVKQEINKLN